MPPFNGRTDGPAARKACPVKSGTKAVCTACNAVQQLCMENCMEKTPLKAFPL